MRAERHFLTEDGNILFPLILVDRIITVIKSPVVYEVVNNVVIETDIHRIDNCVIVQFIWRYECMMSQRKHKH
jgi:hypothetical protein